MQINPITPAEQARTLAAAFTNHPQSPFKKRETLPKPDPLILPCDVGEDTVNETASKVNDIRENLEEVGAVLKAASPLTLRSVRKMGALTSPGEISPTEE